jgi:acetolactate synthase-1/2/3 large subunit
LYTLLGGGSMKITGAEAVIRCLQAEGVEVIFGFPGGAVLHLYDALYQSSLTHILTRHEQGAAHAADGYARVTGRVGVCLATSGPGATNLVTGIANAYMDSVPMVIITGQVATDLIGTDAFQEVDITGITAPITKHNYLVKQAKDIPRIMKEAFFIARTGRPGPVLVDIPVDVSADTLVFKYPDDVDLPGYRPTTKGHLLQIERVIQALKQSRKPVIVAGGGVISANASDLLVKLAETQQIPVANTMMGMGSIPADHPLSLGMLGLHGRPAANYTVSDADLLIGIGVRFGDRVTRRLSGFAPQAKIIHMDVDPAEIGKNVKVDIPVVGDIANILAAVCQQLPIEWDASPWLEKVKQWQDMPMKHHETNGIKPEFIMKELASALGSRGIITTEVGQHQMWTAQHYPFLAPRTLVSSGGLGAMGFGLPASIGAQIGCPDKIIFNISGDGSFQMNMQELGTALEYDLPIKILILNNRSLGMVRQLQEFYCDGRYCQVMMKKVPDFAAIARAYGAMGIQVSRADEVRSAIEQAIAHPGLALIDCYIETSENVFPMVPNGAALYEMIGG